MNKQLLYKAAKSFFYVAGFPMMLVMMLITLAPMFNVEVMGNHAANWIIVFFVLWAVFEAVRFVLNRFVGRRSERHQKVVVVATAVFATQVRRQTPSRARTLPLRGRSALFHPTK